MEEESVIYYGLIIGIIAMIILAGGFILVFSNYQRGIMKKQQQLHQLEILHKQELINECLKSSEEERLRIAKDIHDELGGIFSTLILSLNLKQAEFTNTNFNPIKEIAESGLKSVRRISHSIIPFELELLGLKGILANLLSNFEEHSKIKVDSILHFYEDTFDKESQLAIYRIIQELLSNCIKHSGADKVELTITSSDNFSKLSYKDNGIGNKGSKITKAGVGLKNIESRASSLGGKVEFNIDDTLQGFNCVIIFPVK